MLRMVGIAVIAAGAAVAFAAAPAAVAMTAAAPHASQKVMPPAGSALSDTMSSHGGVGWVIVTAAFALLGCSIRARAESRPATIG